MNVYSSFIIATKSWKQLICSPTGEQINVVYLYNGMLLSNEKRQLILAPLGLELKNIMLMERSRHKKSIFCMIPFIRSPRTDKTSQYDRNQRDECGS